MKEKRVWSLGHEDPLEKGMATHSSILAYRIPWMEEPGRLQSMESQSNTTKIRTHTQTSTWPHYLTTLATTLVSNEVTFWGPETWDVNTSVEDTIQLDSSCNYVTGNCKTPHLFVYSTRVKCVFITCIWLQKWWIWRPSPCPVRTYMLFNKTLHTGGNLWFCKACF